MLGGGALGVALGADPPSQPYNLQEGAYGAGRMEPRRYP